MVHCVWENRGIDAPESKMPYGKEAKEALAKLVQGKCLRVLVYDEDRYGRSVGDIYSNGVFVQVQYEFHLRCCFCSKNITILISLPIFMSNQEMMLKKGFAWHYSAYDQRPELAKVSNTSVLQILKTCSLY